MASLKLASGPGSGQRIELSGDVILRLGRGASPAPPEPGVEHRQIDDKRLSRAHCELSRASDGWIVRDLESSNGTFVNGERITEQALANGDLLQVGGTIFEVEGVEPPAPVSDSATSQAPAAPRAPRQVIVRRRVRRKGNAVAYSVLAAGVLVAAGVGFKLLAPERTGTGSLATRASPPTGSPHENKTAGPPAAVPAAVSDASTDPTETVEEALRGGEFRRALEVAEQESQGAFREKVDALRVRVRDAAVAALSERLRDSERLAGGGDFSGARERIEELLPRLPDDLSLQAAVSLERLRKLESSREDDPRRADAPASSPVLARKAAPASGVARVTGLQASFRELSERKSTSPEDWSALRASVASFIREKHGDPGFGAEREQARSLYIACSAKAPDAIALRGAFAASRVELRGARLTLVYDFEKPEQARDFHAVGNGSKVEVSGGALKLRGECRLLDGEPFEGLVSLRGKVGGGGYDAESPNINVAFFTRQGTPLTNDLEKAPSLFNSFLRGSGPEPNDFIAFCLGYRAVTAVYGAKLLEQLRTPESPDALKMPVHAVLVGKHGMPLHSDIRECLWAVPSAGMPRGQVSFEIHADGTKFGWSVNGAAVVDLDDPRFERIRAPGSRAGSVTLFTRKSEVTFDSLELEGTLSEEWAREATAQRAERELDALEEK